MKIGKRTFINVLFSKTQNRIGKNITSSLLQRPLAPFPRPYLYALIFIWGRGHVQTIMLRIAGAQYRRTDGPKDGPTDGEAVFANSWMTGFGG